VTSDADATWTRIQHELRRAVDPGAYELWLTSLRLVAIDGATLVLSAPEERRGWIAHRFGSVLRSCARAVLGEDVDVHVRSASETRPGASPARTRVAPASRTPLSDEPEPRLNPKLRFDQFVIGDSNRLAHAAALAVAELPGTAYNPLFIYGPPGVGKTHLLHSIANYLVTYSPELRVRYTTAERFTNEFIAAVQSREIERFKGAWRGNDVLLIDDVQFLESKARTEEEFFHTFNALYDAGAQLVLTSDRLPRDLAALEDRLRERFEAGLVTDIRQPDRVVRRAILRKRAQQDGIALADEHVLDAIADRIEGSVRELEGALIRCVAYASLTGRPLSTELADEVLAGLYPDLGVAPGRRPSPPSIARIQQAVCEQFGLTTDELLSSSRAARIARPRQLAMYLARVHTEASLPTIGAAFGGRNHTTVMHAVRKVERELKTDADLEEALRAVTNRLADRHD
jgi:chromosomal replication initiator protein